jgi:uncharacterized repeat protein (TIGR01451 family)
MTAQNVTYKPYIQLGDAPTFGVTEHIVVAWQTDESVPNNAAYSVDYGTSTSYGSSLKSTGRVVDNYLSADSNIPVPPTAPGPRVNYLAVLAGLTPDTTYFYRVTGPGMPSGGFTASFHSRKQTGPFSFLVEGDEGYFPPESGTPTRLADFEARVVQLMNNVTSISFSGEQAFPKPDLSLNTGDNVYNQGAESSYRDYWFPVWNADKDSNETGAPLVRGLANFIVVGNHDTGGNGDFVNMLGGDGISGPYNGATEGGDALAYYNNYYYPLNGPLGADSQYVWNGDLFNNNGWFLSYNSQTYNSPAALQAYRNSTNVDTGGGPKNQIDHMTNYSFDWGNAHFLFLDADPHLFNAQVDFTPTYGSAPVGFSIYPSLFRNWVIQDLDSTSQPWKFVVFHQPSFSSGNATIRNFQMRSIAKTLEDHGVNMVFNGHEHNYQRTYPIRALPGVAESPTTLLPPVVEVDTSFDGLNQTVPDGVVYVIEGTGGNRDFDGNVANPRGQGPGVDEEDSATGTFTYGPGLTFPNGPAGWLDTSLTNAQMAPFLPNAGAGQKVTAKFKAKVFGFGDVIVNDGRLTLYQITEPLLKTSSATTANPAPYGTGLDGKPLNDPIPDTMIDPATGQVVSTPADGTPAMLDKFTITRPDVSASVSVNVDAPANVVPGGAIVYKFTVTNNSQYALNGSQVSMTLPKGMEFDGQTNQHVTLHSRNTVVLTLGRLVQGEQKSIRFRARAAEGQAKGSTLSMSGILRSATALPISIPAVSTTIGQ